MRVLYLTDTREIGGAERYLATLAQAAAHRHEVLVLAPQRELVAWLARGAPRANVARAFAEGYHDAPGPIRRAGALATLLGSMTRSLRTLAPDAIHVNNGGFPGSDRCRMAIGAARLAGVHRRMRTVHSNPVARAHRSDPRVQAVVDQMVWSSVHVVISPSNAVAEGLRVRRLMPPALGRTIYYGVAAARADPAGVARLRERLAAAGELLVGMVCARPVAEKGHDLFVYSLAAW